ncbi:MAG: glycosyltransferase family 2 protein [Nocardioides sp.]
MNVISIITPVHPPSIPYLDEAYRSLTSQALPDGWAWEWLVQLDGLDWPNQWAPDDPRVFVGRGPTGGPGVTRNVALARSHGILIRNLDADDQLLPGALARDIAALEANPQATWTVTRVLDLASDGTTSEWVHPNPPRASIPRNSIREQWTSNSQWLLPVHPTTLCVRRHALLCLGGWMALPSGEDTGLLLALDATGEGYYIDEPSALYRKHDDQVTAQDFHLDSRNKADRRAIAIERASALDAAGWRFSLAAGQHQHP